jgi:hypothetical protein
MLDKVELVKEIILNLSNDVENRDKYPQTEWPGTSLPVERFLSREKGSDLARTS